MLNKAQQRPFMTQLYSLTKREYQDKLRNWQLLTFRSVVPFLQVFIQGLVFWSIGRGGLRTGQTVEGANASSADFLNMAKNLEGPLMNLHFVMFGACGQQALINIPLERPIFIREYKANMYSIPAYLTAKVLWELPQMMFICFVVLATGFIFLGLNGSFLIHYCLLLFTALSGGAIGLLLACVAPGVPEIAVTFAQLALATLPNAVSGIFRPISEIPIMIRWIT